MRFGGGPGWISGRKICRKREKAGGHRARKGVCRKLRKGKPEFVPLLVNELGF
jgi:hypothetical protein